MKTETFLDITHLLERLKDTPRHCYTSGGRRESVAEHVCRLAQMALFLEDDFPEVDIDRVIRMCLIHDLGEIFTGDIPCFLKTEADAEKEDGLLDRWIGTLPDTYPEKFRALLAEMAEDKTPEAKLYAALDAIEGVIQHNESDIATWAENEYDLTMHYGDRRCEKDERLWKLREAVREETKRKTEAK